MSPKHFFVGLAITSLSQLLICFLLYWLIPATRAHISFIAITILAMIFFSILLYGAAKVYAKSTLVRLYIQLIMVAVLVVYKKGFEPIDNSFIWPFLFIYLASAIFEVVFMERVGREQHISKT